MRLTQKGDTIVEVLIAIAVISAVLGTSYSIVNRNVQGGQQSQEHSQALKVAEAQLEQLKSYLAAKTIPLIPSVGTNFCMYVDSAPDPDVSKFDTTTTSTNCKQDDGNIVDRYTTIISQASAGTYVVNVTWIGPKGGNDRVSLAYRVY